MKNKKKIGFIKLYLKWPIVFSVLIILINVVVYLCDVKIGFMLTPFFLAYIVMLLIMYYQRTKMWHANIVKYSANYDKIQNVLLKELSVPYAILDSDGALLWGNKQFINVIENESAAKRSIFNIFHEMRAVDLPKENDTEFFTEYKDKFFKVEMKKIDVSELFCTDDEENEEDIDKTKDNKALIAMYLHDETSIKKYQKENNDQKTVLGLIYIDNYEEVFENIDEVKRVILSALVERKITKYMQNAGAVIKRLEKDKYIVILKKKDLNNLRNNKFSLLEEVSKLNVGNEIAITLSMGVGVDAESMAQSYEYARASIDLALGRGGDQVVIKSSEKVDYFGGKQSNIEKNTKVKARVKAHALKEIFIAKDDIMIMGHSIGDLDSFGASIGIYRIAKTLQKRVHIVLDKPTSSVKPFLDKFLKDNEYEDDMFVNERQAMEMINNNTVMVIVDVARPSYTECPKLLELSKTVIVIDHHRQSGDIVENLVISYVDPGASSASEMVVEILQYVDDKLKMRPVEADVMYAGMVVDTNNFMTRTGVRTFEAAAFLRKNNANVIRVRKLLRADATEYGIKAEAIKKVEVFLEYYAITEMNAEGIESPTVVGAKVANELLNMAGIKASFVITPYNDKMYVSARSIDEANVQIIMEKFGGGGHMNMAGAQLEGVTIEEAKNMIKEKIAEMISNGEL